jgi:hypothetical protein
MSAPAVNLTINKGTDFEAIFTVTNSDGSAFSLANYSATSKIRKHPTAAAYKSFSTTITVATGEIKVSMGATTTSTLSSGRNYYDVIITNVSTGKITKVFDGMVLAVDTVSV